VTPAAEDAPDEVADAPPAVWSWRRPEPVETPEEQPFELTVSPTKPFTSVNDDRQKSD
jgi:hypothetical protein